MPTGAGPKGADSNPPTSADSALYVSENSRLSQRFSVLQQNTQDPPLHTNSSTSAEASQVNSTCHLAAASLLMQGDALATNLALRLAIRSSASAAGVHSVEDLFGAGVPITLPASAVCTRETISNSNRLEPSIHSTLGIRDIPNASPDVVSLVANQIGGSPQVTEQPINYDIQLLKTVEIGATSTTTLLDNSVSTSANASQPEFSTKITEQQETPYAIQPINPIEIGTTSSDPLLDCPDILQSPITTLLGNPIGLPSMSKGDSPLLDQKVSPTSLDQAAFPELRSACVKISWDSNCYKR
ncbi:hypothetical protein F0562_010382 [Nyssa sinensis]|uniref:Uncharacterized protein n=1 Tax=Nyssa sinensis TaxID=561372 RepID=A0A5J5A4H6_9ASTE|nr:hypothetical protein F0562_010382 [Nyssa sinensis]